MFNINPFCSYIQRQVPYLNWYIKTRVNIHSVVNVAKRRVDIIFPRMYNIVISSESTSPSYVYVSISSKVQATCMDIGVGSKFEANFLESTPLDCKMKSFFNGV